jgi:putative transposase
MHDRSKNVEAYLETPGIWVRSHIVTVRRERRYLWRAVDQESLPHKRSECCGYGDVLDILVEKRNDKRAAERFFKKLMKG